MGMTNEEARRTLEWVEEHLECVGGPFKETYIAGLKAVDELLKEQGKEIKKLRTWKMVERGEVIRTYEDRNKAKWDDKH